MGRSIISLAGVVFFCLHLLSSVSAGQTPANAVAQVKLPVVGCWTGADFWIGGQPPDVSWPANLADPEKRKELVLWGSWCGQGQRVGGVELGPFIAPDHFSMLIAGMPFDKGNVLKIVRISDLSEIIITRDNIGNVWKQFDIVLPKDWAGQYIKIVAWDVSTDSWVALSEPFVIRKTGTVRALWSDRTRSSRGRFWWNETLGPITLIFIIYAAIGVAGYSLLRRFIQPAPFLAPILICAITGVLGYITFWAYFWGPFIGRAVDWGIVCASAGYLVICCLLIRRKFPLTGEEFREIKWPLILMIIALFFDLGVVGYPRVEGTPFEVLASRRPTTYCFASDNVLQENLSAALFNGLDPRTASDPEWQSSDRPPLEGSLQLLCGPMVMSMFHLYWNTNAQMSGVVFQLSWVLGVWALVRAMGCSPRSTVAILLCLMPTPLLYINTVYVWAKLAAAAYALGMTVILCFRSKRPLTLVEAGVAGALLSLGMLCHSGIFFFALPVLGLWFVVPSAGRRPGFKPALVLVAVAAAIFIPWTCYQKLVDPPGNRLLKLSFAGAASPNSVPMMQAICDAYKAHSGQEIYQFKLSNFQEIFRGDWPTFFSPMPPDRLERRTSGFLYLFRSFGIYLLGFAALPLLFLSRNKDKRRPVFFLLTALTIAIVIWCLLMFGPETTIVHAGAYGVPLVFLVVLLYLIRMAHPLLLLIAGIYNLIQFLWVYAWSYPYPPRTDRVAFDLIIASFVLSILLLIFAPGESTASVELQPS